MVFPVIVLPTAPFCSFIPSPLLPAALPKVLSPILLFVMLLFCGTEVDWDTPLIKTPAWFGLAPLFEMMLLVTVSFIEPLWKSTPDPILTWPRWTVPSAQIPMLLPWIVQFGAATVMPSFSDPAMLRFMMLLLGADEVMKNNRSIWTWGASMATPDICTLGPIVLLTPFTLVSTSEPSIVVAAAIIGGMLPNIATPGPLARGCNTQKLLVSPGPANWGVLGLCPPPSVGEPTTVVVLIPAKPIVHPEDPLTTLSLLTAVMASRRLIPVPPPNAKLGPAPTRAANCATVQLMQSFSSAMTVTSILPPLVTSG